MLAEKNGMRRICKKLLKTGCFKRNLETFKWKVKSDSFIESLISESFS